jgi:hypothetical protein
VNKLITALIAGLLVAAAPTLVHADQCRDAKGKFIKCPPIATAPAKPTQCRDAKGKFSKCPAAPALAKKGPCRDPKTGRFIKCK